MRSSAIKARPLANGLKMQTLKFNFEFKSREGNLKANLKNLENIWKLSSLFKVFYSLEETLQFFTKYSAYGKFPFEI